MNIGLTILTRGTINTLTFKKKRKEESLILLIWICMQN